MNSSGEGLFLLLGTSRFQTASSLAVAGLQRRYQKFGDQLLMFTISPLQASGVRPLVAACAIPMRCSSEGPFLFPLNHCLLTWSQGTNFLLSSSGQVFAGHDSQQLRSFRLEIVHK